MPTDLTALLAFVTDFQWIWNIKMTRIFIQDHLLNIPKEWRDVMIQWETAELKDVINDHKKLSLPPSLNEYLAQCHHLSLSLEVPKWVSTNEIKIINEITRGMSPKKQHEVSRLSGVVRQVCQDSGCDAVVDIGSGLGYLGTCLASQCGFRVICIERDKQRVDSAIIRERILLQSHVSHMTTVSMSLDNSTRSRDALMRLIQEQKVSRVCLVGLHCCGDLSPTLLRLMVSPPHPSLTSAAIVPCCYHKMFADFPLSQCLKWLVSSSEYKFAPLNVYALRLAAQESLESWKCHTSQSHAEHTKHVAYRAILEKMLENTNETLSGRLHRKADYSDFDGYISSLMKDIQGISHDEAMRQYDKCSGLFPLIEPFTALQGCMQRVLETLVLADQLEFLRENGINADLVPVFDVDISPRAFAIIVRRRT